MNISFGCYLIAQYDVTFFTNNTTCESLPPVSSALADVNAQVKASYVSLLHAWMIWVTVQMSGTSRLLEIKCKSYGWTMSTAPNCEKFFYRGPKWQVVRLYYLVSGTDSGSVTSWRDTTGWVPAVPFSGEETDCGNHTFLQGCRLHSARGTRHVKVTNGSFR